MPAIKQAKTYVKNIVRKNWTNRDDLFVLDFMVYLYNLRPTLKIILSFFIGSCLLFSNVVYGLDKEFINSLTNTLYKKFEKSKATISKDGSLLCNCECLNSFEQLLPITCNHSLKLGIQDNSNYTTLASLAQTTKSVNLSDTSSVRLISRQNRYAIRTKEHYLHGVLSIYEVNENQNIATVSEFWFSGIHDYNKFAFSVTIHHDAQTKTPSHQIIQSILDKINFKSPK